MTIINKDIFLWLINHPYPQIKKKYLTETVTTDYNTYYLGYM